MKLDRNINKNKMGKYALLKLRKLESFCGPGTFDGLSPEIAGALGILERAGILDRGIVGTESEFFVIRLRDKYAAEALTGYQRAVEHDWPLDREYADEIRELALRAGPNSPFCKKPD